MPDPQRHQVESARAISLDVHRSVERSIPLQLGVGQALVVEGHYGNVSVTADAHGSPRCHAVVEISAADGAGADTLERTIGLRTRSTEKGLQVFLEEPERDGDLVYVASASLEIFVPPGTPLEIQLERGDLDGIGPFGKARVETDKGDLRLRRVDGGVIARSSVGDVKLRQCTGGPVRASTDSGMIAFLGSRSETVRLESARGRIVVNTASGGTFECFARQGAVRLISVDAIVSVEAGTTVRVEDFGGKSLRIEKGEGQATLKNVRADLIEFGSSGGATELERIQCETTLLRIETGSIVLTDITGSITASTDAGDVDAVQLRGPRSSLSTEQGNVTARGVTGQISTHTGRGKTDVTRVTGDLEISSNQGSITASGALENVVIKGAEGGVLLRSLVGSRPKSAWRISSGHGDLVLFLPADLSFRLEARALDGIIDSAFPIVVGAGVAQDPNTLRGEVAGGGPAIELFSERGNIALRRVQK